MKIRKKIKILIRNRFIKYFNRHSPVYRDVINIIFWKDSKGLYNDAVILRRFLTEAGFKVSLLFHNTKELQMKNRLNIFIQYIYPQFLNNAKYNIIVPNPEWGEHDFQFIRNNFDCVIAKTKDCERIFKDKLDNVYYTSFSSHDVFSENKSERKYIHFAGKSTLKGTKYLINLWNAKKTLPKLYLYSYQNNYKNDIQTDNIEYTFGALSDEEIKYLQNKYIFHLSPSEYEGFGHQINEAKSAGALVFTTDAPPMNELIAADYGYLIKAKYKEMLKNAKIYSIDENDLYQKIISSQDLTKDEIDGKRRKARLSYVNNEIFFKERITKLIGKYFDR